MSALDYLISRALPFVPKPIVRRASARYIAGETLADAVRVVRRLNDEGLMATLDVLGEEVLNRSQAEAAVREYLEALRVVEEERLDSNISVKLTQLGLKLDREYCAAQIRTLVEAARRRGNFVRIDMEDSTCTTATLELYRGLRQAGLDNVGVVLQACLRRTLADARALPEGTSVRLCKGIYVEPRTIAWRDRAIVRRNYARLHEVLLDRGLRVAIATHDEELVWEALRILEERGLRPAAYEFQMLLGVDEELRRIIRDGGHRLRVYVPYGREWHAYSMRRLKENPSIAGYVLKAMLRRSGRPG